MLSRGSHQVRLVGWVIVLVLIAGVGIILVMLRRPTPANQVPPPAVQAVPAASVAGSHSQTLAANSPNLPAAHSGVMPNYPDFNTRPLPVTYETLHFEWTQADGKETNIIRELAHNPLEYERMFAENPKIFKRELVYLKQTAAAVFEQAKLTGEPVTQLTLPGVDGQELQFQVVQSEGNGSSRRGQFSGHLAGNNDSLVTLAFIDGRQAFTILSPKDNIYLVGEPREDGQVIVKAIDPNTYGLGPEEKGDDSIGAQPKPNAK